MNKSKTIVFGFLTLLKVSGTFRVDLTLELQIELVSKLFELLSFIFHGSVPIPNVHAAILNLSK